MNMRNRGIGVGFVSLLVGCVATGCSAAAPQDPAPDPSAVETRSSALSAGDDARHRGCDSAEGRAHRLERMLRSPIRPPNHVGGLDLDQGTFGITFDEISAIDCAPSEVGPPDDFDGKFSALWGDNHEIEVIFNPAKGNAANVFVMHQGYTGRVHFRSRSGGTYGEHEYTIGVGVIERDGKPFPVDFSADDEHIEAQVTEIFDAAIATFQPDEAPVDNCFTTNKCLIIPDDDAGDRIVGLRGGIDFYWVTPIVDPHGPELVYTVWRPAN